MRKFLFAMALAPMACAQAPTVAPPILEIACQPGYSATPAKPYAEAKAGVEALGVTSVTGIPQTWTIELHNNFASVEDLDKAIAATGFTAGPRELSGPPQEDLLAPPRDLIAIYQPEWSYRADEAVRLLPKAHYISVTVHRIRLGMEEEFEQLVRLRKFALDSINLNRPELGYRVISGAPAGMYLLIAPLVNLRWMDEGVADVPAFAAPAVDERAKAAPKQAEMVVGRENMLFRVEPRLSYISDDFAAGDQAFWRGKAAPQQ